MKIFFILLFIIIPSITILFGSNLSFAHFVFYFSALVLTFGKKEDWDYFLWYLQNFDKIKIGNLIQLERQIDNLKNLSNIEPIKTNSQSESDISKKYAKELSFSNLNFKYNFINNQIREIYSLIYSDDVSHIDNILIFNYLKQQEILNEDFCFYVYSYCTLVIDFLNKPNFDNSSKINDLLEIADDIIVKLNYVKKYIIDNHIHNNQTV